MSRKNEDLITIVAPERPHSRSLRLMPIDTQGRRCKAPSRVYDGNGPPGGSASAYVKVAPHHHLDRTSVLSARLRFDRDTFSEV